MTIHFATFKVDKQVFFKSKLSFGLVNLKPILPGHVLVCPQRVVPRLADLHEEEVTDLFSSVRLVSTTLQRAYNAQGATVSLQVRSTHISPMANLKDGPVAGQSVRHVHVHVIPRKANDLPQNDEIYGRIDADSASMADIWQRQLEARPQFTAVDDESRHPRTEQVMQDEANWLKTLF